MSSNSSIQVRSKAEMLFTQIDDVVAVYVNGEQVFDHGLIHHGQPSVTFNLLPHLRSGTNSVRVTAENGPGWGVLKGTLTTTAGSVYNWNYVNANAPKNSVFLDETIEVEYLPVRTVVSFAQIDDKVTVTLNGSQVFAHGIIRHNEPKVEFDLTDKLNAGSNTVRVVAENGPGWGVLIGALNKGNGAIHNWKYINANAPKNSVFLDETVNIEL